MRNETFGVGMWSGKCGVQSAETVKCSVEREVWSV